MNCDKTNENIPLLINNSLNAHEERKILEHLLVCEDCRQELAFWIEVSIQQKSYDKEFLKRDKDKIYADIKDKELTAVEATKQAVKIYFKVIRSII